LRYRFGMTALPDAPMTVDEFLAWAEPRSGRYELINGVVHAMTPERAAHADMKGAVYMALVTTLRSRNVPCRAFPDGMTVRIDDTTAHEPDALVYCGPKLPPDATEVPNPIIVVEVLSPSSRQVDAALKLANYFRVASVAHYLIINPDAPLVIHHARQADQSILTQIVRQGSIVLDPPGISIELDALYAGA
jgi:Uma2 family endonuclease